MQSEELKPCPFCGGNNLRFRLSDIEGWIAHVECTDCDDMLGPMSEYKYDDKEDAEKDAAEVWNRRPALEAALSAAEPVAWQFRCEIFPEWQTTDQKPGDQLQMEYETGVNMKGLEVRALYAATPAPSVAVKARKPKLPPLSNELYEYYPSMSAQTHTEAIKDYARDAVDAALSAQVQDVAGTSAADQIIGQIEEIFPNWPKYRDLVDCIICELHELRQRAEGQNNG